MIGYLIVSPEGTRIGAYHNAFPEDSNYDAALDLRGRERGRDLVQECQSLVGTIAAHSALCDRRS